MLLIPGIDIKDGKCVRLAQGQMDKVTIYSDDPALMAGKWVGAGARRLHIIDLDGAVTGEPVNLNSIRSIVKANPGISIQVGGGIRDEETIRAYLELGINYVIIGTRAVSTPDFVSRVCVEFPGHIIVALDVKNGALATDGWAKLSGQKAADMARGLEDSGVSAIIFTDISRDGMLSRINIDATVALCEQVTIPVIASGGLRNLDDVRALCEFAEKGIFGAITGRAIYEGTLNLSEAQRLADEICPVQ